jgi:hypothetical protein
MKYVVLLLMSLLLVPLSAHAAPHAGRIEFGSHFNLNTLAVYPVRDTFRSPTAPLYAAHFIHPVKGMHVTVALSAVFGSATELVAKQHVYMDRGDNLLMGWLPKEKLSPAFYVVTIRGHGTVLAEGSFTVVGKKVEDIGPCNGCRRGKPRP